MDLGGLLTSLGQGACRWYIDRTHRLDPWAFCQWGVGQLNLRIPSNTYTVRMPSGFGRQSLSLGHFYNSLPRPLHIHCGEGLSGLENFHSIPFSAQNSRRCSLFHPVTVSRSSRSAPTNLVPLSLIMTAG